MDNDHQFACFLITASEVLAAAFAACLPAPAGLQVLSPRQAGKASFPAGSLVFVDCLSEEAAAGNGGSWPPSLAREPVTLVMVAAGGDLERIRQGVLQGASSFITHPFSREDVQRVLVECRQAAAAKFNDRSLPDDQVLQTAGFCGLLGASAGMKAVYRLIEKISASDSNVLIQGESGTGKELVAKAIYQLSGRKGKPFVPVNCAAIPRELLESELFGYVKGAFTGALVNRRGRVEMADGGILFFDEIGDMEPLLQVKVLRLVQEKTVEPLGWQQQPKRVDIRIISATNKDLEKAVRAGEFREDLFFRLNVVPVNLPPLRQRREDIPCLVEHFIRRFNGRCRGETATGISAEALLLLQEYPWPGNVRELENVIERILVMKDGGKILPVDLPAKIIANRPDPAGQRQFSRDGGQIPAEGLSLKGEVTRLEKELIIKALQQSQGVKEKAARLLKMNRTTLIEKIKRNRIDAGEINSGDR